MVLDYSAPHPIKSRLVHRKDLKDTPLQLLSVPKLETVHTIDEPRRKPVGVICQGYATDGHRLDYIVALRHPVARRRKEDVALGERLEPSTRIYPAALSAVAIRKSQNDP